MKNFELEPLASDDGEGGDPAAEAEKIRQKELMQLGRMTALENLFLKVYGQTFEEVDTSSSPQAQDAKGGLAEMSYLIHSSASKERMRVGVEEPIGPRTGDELHQAIVALEADLPDKRTVDGEAPMDAQQIDSKEYLALGRMTELEEAFNTIYGQTFAEVDDASSQEARAAKATLAMTPLKIADRADRRRMKAGVERPSISTPEELANSLAELRQM